MAVIGREDRSHFVIADDRRVDEKAEHARAQEIPEAHRHQIVERPAMALDDAVAAARDAHEVPCIQRDEHQRHHFQRREGGRERHVQFRLSRPVPVMTGADQSAQEIEDGIQIDGAQRRDPPHQPHFVEDDGDHHGDEEFEESFHPQMDDPETPGVHHRVVCLRAVEERGHIEQRNGEGRDQEEICEAAPYRVAPRGRHRAPDEEKPEQKARGQQELPEAAKLQILPSLIAEPEPRFGKPLQDADPFAQHASGDDDDKRTEK